MKADLYWPPFRMRGKRLILSNLKTTINQCLQRYDSEHGSIYTVINSMHITSILINFIKFSAFFNSFYIIFILNYSKMFFPHWILILIMLRFRYIYFILKCRVDTIRFYWTSFGIVFCENSNDLSLLSNKVYLIQTYNVYYYTFKINIYFLRSCIHFISQEVYKK